LDKPRRVIAKVEWRLGELYPRVGLIVTNLSRLAERWSPNPMFDREPTDGHR
jgi:hypothetical protein